MVWWFGGWVGTPSLCLRVKLQLGGGFNPFEKYLSNWESSPNRGENKKYLKPPSSSMLRISET